MKAIKTYTILAVDDQPDNLDVIVRIAEKIGPEYEVLQETNPAVALDIAINEKPDLIITDWEMPDMDGIQFIKALQENMATREIPVIMATGIMTTSENLQMALEAGAVDYLRKPIDPVEFQARVRSMVQLSESFQTIRQQAKSLREERDKSNSLLLNILPKETAQELKDTGNAIVKSFESVSVMFCDIKGFTKISEQLSPEDLVQELHFVFSEIDKIVSRYGLEKIKTIGDAYMCAGGLPVKNTSHPKDAVNAALHILALITHIREERKKHNQPFFEMRIGIHTGPVVAGIVGLHKFQYDIWGDTVNTASRMESSGEVGKLNVSEQTHKLVKDTFSCVPRGQIEAKNKGKINMYFVDEDLPKEV